MPGSLERVRRCPLCPAVLIGIVYSKYRCTARLIWHQHRPCFTHFPLLNYLGGIFCSIANLPNFLEQKEKNKYFRSNGVNLVNDCNQQKINETQGWEAGRVVSSLYNSYFVGDLGTSWETSRDICNQGKGRNGENYLVDRKKMEKFREPTVICHKENICRSKRRKIFSFSDDICIFTLSHRIGKE